MSVAFMLQTAIQAANSQTFTYLATTYQTPFSSYLYKLELFVCRH